MGKLIALIDGSIYSKSVCEHAAWIAGRTGGKVELMHVLGRREGGERADYSGALALGARSALLNELSDLDEQRSKLALQRGRALMADARALLEKTGVAVSGQLRHGDLLEAVTDAEAGADMILIGKRGEGADFAKAHLGSNLERVTRIVEKPLFVAARAFKPISRVLVAFDGSGPAMRAVEYMAQSPVYAGLAVKLVTIGEGGKAAAQALAGAQAVLGKAGMAAETAILPGQPEEVLAEIVAAEDFQHMVMGAAGHSRIRRLFVGSTTLEMIRACPVPILLVR